MTLRTVNIEALDENHFVGISKASGDLSLSLKIDKSTNNGITITPNGIMVNKVQWEGIKSSYTGPGRPDQPTSTVVDGIPTITGREPVGSWYQSTDGGDVGAWLWCKKPNNKWECMIGDTGVITLPAVNLKPGAWLKVRRINNVVYLTAGGLQWGRFGFIGNEETGFVHRVASHQRFDLVAPNQIPVGYRSENSLSFDIYNDDSAQPSGMVYVGGSSDANYIRFTPRSGKIAPNGSTAERFPPVSWTTSDAWPSRI